MLHSAEGSDFMSSVSNFLSSAASPARAAARDKADTSSSHEGATLSAKEPPWNTRSQLTSEGPPAWVPLNRADLLNVSLEQHPRWVVAGKAGPGTFDESYNRYNLVEERDSEAMTMETAWEPHFIVAHELDGNPVEQGSRRLSPARRRHIGGVGFD